MKRRALVAGAILLVPLVAIAACSNDDSAVTSASDSGAAGDGTVGSGDGSTQTDGSASADASKSDAAPPPAPKCGGVGKGTFSGEADPGTPVYANGYSLFFDGLLDAGVGSFTIACAFTDAGLVSHLPAAVGVSTTQAFPNDHAILTFSPSAMDAATAVVSGSVGDD